MRFVLLCSFLALSGCTGKWVKNSISAEKFSQAQYYCEDKSFRNYPVRNEVAQRTAYHPIVRNCKNKKDCNNKKYEIIDIPHIESYSMDVNENSRDNNYKECMHEKGWVKKYF